MPYDEYLANRIREILAERRYIQERNMFGYLAFTHEGNEAVRVDGGRLVVRVNSFLMKEVLDHPYTMPVDKNHVEILPRGIRDDADLKAWVERGISYAATLPPR